MSDATDGCISREVRQKTAATGGALVYLVEEVGDARLRCVQLKKYLDEAVKLIEQSPHHDHFYEVAGHLIEGIPTAAFKLEKALDAVALATNHIDSEELKNSILPEKQKELERVLKDVRIRHPVRRSEVPQMTPKVAADKLRVLAGLARNFGKLPVPELAALIGELETGLKQASSGDVSTALEALADSIVTPVAEGQAPSRAHLAASLRNVLATCVDLARFEEGKPADPTDSMSPEDAAEWKKNTEKHKDKFKSGAARVSAWVTYYKWLDSFLSNWRAYSPFVREAFEEAKSTDNQPQLDAIKRSQDALIALIEARDDIKKYGRESPYRSASEEKDSRFEEGEHADPTQNMSEEDAKKWKTEHAKNKDKFKAGAAELAPKFTPSMKEQLSLLIRNPPRTSTVDGVIVIEIYSPFVKKYIPMSERATNEEAEKDLAIWMKAHRETIQKLRASSKEASDNWKTVEARDWKVEAVASVGALKTYVRSMNTITKDILSEARPSPFVFYGALGDLFEVERTMLLRMGEHDLSRLMGRITEEIGERGAAKMHDQNWPTPDSEAGVGEWMEPKHAAGFDPAAAAPLVNPPANGDAIAEIFGQMVVTSRRAEQFAARGGSWRGAFRQMSFVVGHLADIFTLANSSAGSDLATKLLRVSNKLWIAPHEELDASPAAEAYRLAADEGEHLSRFEEGKPADPTDSMSPEDAAEWKKNTEKHKDKFKGASDPWKVQSKLMSRQEKILKQYLDSTGGRAVSSYDELPSNVQEALRRVKDQETLWSDVDRWLSDNNPPHLRWAADEKDSRFEEGKPADPTDAMSPEDAKEWKKNTEKHKDKFKAA
jgi:hypothetical protein